MSEKSNKLIYLIYGIIQSVLTVVCGGCLIAACLAIYDHGNGAFSRESVAAQFGKIALPVILCLAGVIFGAVLTVVLPREQQKLKGNMAPSDAIKKLFPRLNTQECPPRYIALLKKEQTLRLVLRLVATALCVILAVPCALYLFDLSNFDDIGGGLTEDILAAMFWILPATVAGLAAWTVVTFACHKSYQRELSLLKLAIKEVPAQRQKAVAPVKKSGYAVWLIRGAVFLVAIVFIVLGIVNGGNEDVLEKAIRICTECIGLG